MCVFNGFIYVARSGQKVTERRGKSQLDPPQALHLIQHVVLIVMIFYD